MSDRLKYSNNGVCRFENFADIYLNNPRVRIGSMLYSNTWLELSNENNGTFVRPTFKFSFPYPDKWLFRYFFKISNRDETRIYKSEGTVTCGGEWVPSGQWTPISELLNPENRFLDNGALLVEYGAQIESYLEADSIWFFNFHDKVFDCEQKQNMISFLDFKYPDNRMLFRNCPKLLLYFHSAYFACNDLGNVKIPIANWMKIRDIDVPLQLAHGVQLKIPTSKLIETVEFAYLFNVRNVIRYCENQLIQDWEHLKFLNSSFKETMEEVDFAIDFDMKHYLARLLKTKHCSNRARFSNWILENLELESLSSGVMKLLVKNIFES